MKMQFHDNMSVLSIPHQKKKAFATYRWRMHSQWQFTLIPMVSSNKMTYTIMVSIPVEDIHHHLSPK
jgi:hypothetical protein